jgi:hypothetical protein
LHPFLFFGLLAQVIALLIGIFRPQHLLPSILRLAHEFAVDWIVPAKVVNHTINGDISIDIKPIKRTTGHKSAAFVGGFNTINVPTKMVWASTASCILPLRAL